MGLRVREPSVLHPLPPRRVSKRSIKVSSVNCYNLVTLFRFSTCYYDNRSTLELTDSYDEVLQYNSVSDILDWKRHSRTAKLYRELVRSTYIRSEWDPVQRRKSSLGNLLTLTQCCWHNGMFRSKSGKSQRLIDVPGFRETRYVYMKIDNKNLNDPFFTRIPNQGKNSSNLYALCSHHNQFEKSSMRWLILILFVTYSRCV